MQLMSTVCCACKLVVKKCADGNCVSFYHCVVTIEALEVRYFPVVAQTVHAGHPVVVRSIRRDTTHLYIYHFAE